MTIRTLILAMSLSAPAFAVGTSSTTIGKLRPVETLELKMRQFDGADGFPSYEVVGHGPFAGFTTSLRCEQGYHSDENRKPYSWEYREIFISDAQGPANERVDAKARGQIENGYRFKFANADECQKASPTILTGTAVCTMKIQIRKASATAKFLSATCKESDAPSSGR